MSNDSDLGESFTIGVAVLNNLFNTAISQLEGQSDLMERAGIDKANAENELTDTKTQMQLLEDEIANVRSKLKDEVAGNLILADALAQHKKEATKAKSDFGKLQKMVLQLAEEDEELSAAINNQLK